VEYTLTKKGGEAVAGFLSTPQKPARADHANGASMSFIADDLLDANTACAASVSAVVDGKSFLLKWEFATGEQESDTRRSLGVEGRQVRRLTGPHRVRRGSPRRLRGAVGGRQEVHERGGVERYRQPGHDRVPRHVSSRTAAKATRLAATGAACPGPDPVRTNL
jgi:hypothetical protein